MRRLSRAALSHLGADSNQHSRSGGIRPLRVLLAAEHPRDASLGSAKYILRLAEAIAAEGHEVDTAFASDLPAWMAGRPARNLTFPVHVARLGIGRRYDVIHVASGDGFLAAAVARLLPRRRRPRMVSQVLGIEHLAWEEFLAASTERIRLRHRLSAGFVRLRQVEASIRLSDLAVCISEGDRGFVLERGWLPAARVITVHPGVDAVFHESPAASLDGSAIFFLGSWTTRKGISELGRAFQRVRRQLPSARLVVAGSRVGAAAVLASLPADVREAVEVVGDFPDPPLHLVELIRAAAVGAMPSHYEGFGMAFAEMMALGLPVVGTPTGGMADLIESGANGFLVPPHAADQLAARLIEVLGDAQLRRRMGAAARRTALGLTWKRSAQAVVAGYERLLAGE